MLPTMIKKPAKPAPKPLPEQERRKRMRAAADFENVVKAKKAQPAPAKVH